MMNKEMLEQVLEQVRACYIQDSLGMENGSVNYEGCPFHLLLKLERVVENLLAGQAMGRGA